MLHSGFMSSDEQPREPPPWSSLATWVDSRSGLEPGTEVWVLNSVEEEQDDSTVSLNAKVDDIFENGSVKVSWLDHNGEKIEKVIPVDEVSTRVIIAIEGFVNEHDSSDEEVERKEEPRSQEPVPEALRPAWLPTSGAGQSNIDPLRWNLSIEQWCFFVNHIALTPTWKALGRNKGEWKINMYDVNEHFVKPWTRGTGSSLALLLNPDPTEDVELMISHAWGGSVFETHWALKNMAQSSESVDPSSRIFFCTFCMYQCQDDAVGGLSIGQQLELEPFAKIIDSRPPLGMRVVHTTAYEVYVRLWTVHEVDEGKAAGIEMKGICDMRTFKSKHFKKALNLDTRLAQCRAEDKPMLDKKIEDRGGYDRLNQVIKKFRTEMLVSFQGSSTGRMESYDQMFGSVSYIDGMSEMNEERESFEFWGERYKSVEARLQGLAAPP